MSVCDAALWFAVSKWPAAVVLLTDVSMLGKLFLAAFGYIVVLSNI